MRSYLRSGMALAVGAGLMLAQALIPAESAELSSGKTLKYNPKFPPPAPLYSDLMSAIQNQVVWKEGRIQMNGRLRALFFPEYNDPKHSYAYNTATGARLAHQVKKADGAVVNTQFYSGQKLKRPFWMMHPADTEKYELEDGDYYLEFFLEGKPF